MDCQQDCPGPNVTLMAVEEKCLQSAVLVGSVGDWINSTHYGTCRCALPLWIIGYTRSAPWLHGLL